MAAYRAPSWLASVKPDRGRVDRRGVAWRPAGQLIDRVDVDEAVVFVEGPRSLVRGVAGRAVQGFDRHDADSGLRQVVHDVVEQPGSVALAAPGSVDGDPQDLRAAG